jgi:hypothetical protein
MIAASRSQFIGSLESRAAATGERITPMVADLLYRYLEYQTLRMLFGVAPFDQVSVRDELGYITGERS